MLSGLRRNSLRVQTPKLVIVGGMRPTLIVGPSSRSTIVIGPATLQRVVPPPRSVWEEKGWARIGNAANTSFSGAYQVTDRHSGLRQRFDGRIEMLRREPVAYICRPPAQIRAHPKGPCFNLVENDWFRLHWHRPAKNVDDAILYVERILDEVINRRGTWTS